MLNESDRQKIESLYRRFGKGVGSYVMARTANRALAESITARVFLIVVQRFDQCQESRVGWLWSIVRSELARHFRDRKAYQPLDLSLAEESPDPLARLEAAEMSERMRLALGALGEPSHTLIYMKFFLDLSNVEIAQELNMSAGNVGVTAHRALRRLRELMAETDCAPVAEPAAMIAVT